jgi:hypothetical protein
MGDFQTVAMIIAILSRKDLNVANIDTYPHHTQPPLIPKPRPKVSRLSKQSSKSIMSSNGLKHRSTNHEIYRNHDFHKYYDSIIAYSDYLLNMELLTSRASLLNAVGLMTNKQEVTSVVSFNPLTSLPCTCYAGYCRYCKSKGKCPYCNLPMFKGVSFCSECLHGGHIKCMKKWLDVSDKCILGCGCKCKSARTKN